MLQPMVTYYIQGVQKFADQNTIARKFPKYKKIVFVDFYFKK